ncbi:MAG: PKD domain-containing protein, partial [Pseudomonadota bacterium]
PLHYEGGSLGQIEFNGKYQSIANQALFDVELVQNTELFAPPIPYIEVSGSIANAGAAVDEGNLVAVNYPTASNLPLSTPSTYPNLGNPGTFYFCEKGGLITLNGFPKATSGVSSTGVFTLFDKASSLAIPPGAFFTDNGNGVATINPDVAASGFNNGYKTILVRYEYQAKNSPCKSIATKEIRITPNPVAAFNQGVLCESLNPADPGVPFTDTSTLNTATGISITKWGWNFGDPGSGTNNVSIGTNPAVNKNPTHNYADGGPKPNVTLQVETNVGCQSVVEANKQLNIGSTPNVNFVFEGVDVSQSIQFTDSTKIATGGTFAGPYTDGGTNDGFAKLEWDFGTPPLPAATVFSTFRAVKKLVAPDYTASKTYSAPGQYLVTLKVTSQKGCVSQKSQLIVVLPRVPVTPTSAYREDFESPSGGNWQTIPDPGSSVPSSWVRTTTLTGKASIAIDPSINGSTSAATRTIWVTNASGNYSNRERSALYSPSFDMSTLLRPMISFNSYVQFLPSDGVIVQYSVDNKNITDPTKKWHTIGAGLGEGVDWFNTQGLGAKPGNQPDKDFGWSSVDVKRWQESKHTIINEPLPKEPILGQTRVVFRFAMAGLDNATRADGIAIDNFRFGERTRTILMENFANTSNAQGAGSIIFEKRESVAIKDFNSSSVGTEVVKVNYHTGLPGQ